MPSSRERGIDREREEKRRREAEREKRRDRETQRERRVRGNTVRELSKIWDERRAEKLHFWNSKEIGGVINLQKKKV